MKVRKCFSATAAVVSLLLIVSSCSTAPKPQMVLTDNYKMANQIFLNANSALASGRLTEAKKFLSQAYTGAVAVDSKTLLARISLSAIIYSLNAGLDTSVKTDGEEFPVLPARELLLLANEYASLSSEKNLLMPACSVYKAVILLSENTPASELEKISSELSGVQKALSSDLYLSGFLIRVSGDVRLALNDFNGAESFYREAAAFHEKNCFVNETGNDWYSLSKCLSRAGKYADALDAIDKALVFDRNAENTYAIASDYYARSLILSKTGDVEHARKDALWAAQVFDAGGFSLQAQTACESAE